MRGVYQNEGCGFFRGVLVFELPPLSKEAEVPLVQDMIFSIDGKAYAALQYIVVFIGPLGPGEPVACLRGDLDDREG